MSRACKELVDPFLYRRVEIKGQPEKQLALSARLLDRILNPDDTISSYTRHLSVVDFEESLTPSLADKLEKAVAALGRLHTFT